MIEIETMPGAQRREEIGGASSSSSLLRLVMLFHGLKSGPSHSLRARIPMAVRSDPPTLWHPPDPLASQLQGDPPTDLIFML